MTKKFKIVYYFLVTVLVMVFSYQVYRLAATILERPEGEPVNYIANED